MHVGHLAHPTIAGTPPSEDMDNGESCFQIRREFMGMVGGTRECFLLRVQGKDWGCAACDDQSSHGSSATVSHQHIPCIPAVHTKPQSWVWLQSAQLHIGSRYCIARLTVSFLHSSCNF